MDTEHTYLCIDLKSFYASVECVERHLDPLTTNLVVADASRSQKTICLAVSPSLKAYGIPGRPRLFEVCQTITEQNLLRKQQAPEGTLTGTSSDAIELERNPALAIDFITAVPQMARYMTYSTRIYRIYLESVAPEDIHVYSIDEVFIDLTHYLKPAGLTARQFAGKLIRSVEVKTGITATAGIGSNLYLAKVAMDIMSKHIPPDENGLRIASLTEAEYRKNLWAHQPITDFWRVGKGYARKLSEVGLFTMGDIARCSLGEKDAFHNEALLYRLLGINAELLIDHAWGWEPCTMEDIRNYRPASNSLGSGQVLDRAYPYEQAETVVKEMADQLALDLFRKHFVTDQLVLTVGYDIENLKNPQNRERYHGEITTDRYGRSIPKHAHGTEHLPGFSSSGKQITAAVLRLFRRIVNPGLLIRRLQLTACHVTDRSNAKQHHVPKQLDLFDDSGNAADPVHAAEEQKKEEKMQQALVSIKDRFGKNAIVKGLNLKEGATGMERNNRIGGHKA